MTTPWDRTLRLVQEELPDGHVERIDPVKSGGWLAQVSADGKLCWLLVDDRGARRVAPEDDSKLPLAARLAEWRTRETVQILSWRKERRIAVSVGRSSVWKGVRRRRGAAAHARHQLAASALQASPVDVPELLEYDTEHEAMHLARRPGSSPPIESAAAPVFQSLGQALRQLQGHDGDVPHHTALNELAALDMWADRVREIRGELPGGWEQARGQVQQLEQHEDAPSGLAHRDLHDGQLLVHGDELVLLDFDMLSQADTALDAGNLRAHLHLRVWQGQSGADQAGAARCGSALLAGLDRNDEADFERRVAGYEAATLLRLALVYSLRPAWTQLAEVMLARSRQLLSDGE